MESEGVKRKLAAILAADMVGYSRLMEADEAGTLAALKGIRKYAIDPAIAGHDGRLVKTTGDGVLVEFASVADAMRCAVEIQQSVTNSNAAVADERRIAYRIGVNLGEIIIDGDDIYGNGVNVAVRLESIAEPGGICVSGTVYEQVSGILDLVFDDLGDQSLKNIKRPIRGYAVRMGESGPADDDGSARHTPPPAAHAAPDAPSIAVLPFDNMSADREQEYFCDGMVEDIITALSKISGLLVIARTSTFTYKGKPVDVKQIGRDLGVRYVLEGSVRKSGDKVRITAQLIDAGDGTHVWAARFDRDLTDIFALQDEITRNVVSALHVRLVEGEQARVWHRATENLAAWECLMHGRAHFRRFGKAENARARGLFEKSVELDPGYSTAWVWLGWSHWTDVRNLWSENASASLARAEEHTQKAVTLDENLSEVHALLGAIHLMKGNYDDAIAEGEKAVALEPDGADLNAMLAMTLNWSGRPEAAVALVEKAMRLSPMYPAWYLAVLAHACRLGGDFEKAVTYARQSIARNPENMGPRIGLIVSCIELGREDEARAQAQEVMNLNRAFSLSKYAGSLTYRDAAVSERGLAALRSAGLPE